MPFYRKKPVIIEAHRFGAYTQALRNGELYQWLTKHGARFELLQEDPGPACLLISTLEGQMVANVGDFIIRGVAGEFYPCKPAIFAATYEAVPDTEVSDG